MENSTQSIPQTTELAYRQDDGPITWRLTDEGFLLAVATFSKVGPLVYQRADGTTFTEYVEEDELFDPDSLVTASFKPVLDGHPEVGKIDSFNATQFQRGMSGTRIIRNGPFAQIEVVITDEDLKQDIISGRKKQLSAGYTTFPTTRRDGKTYQTRRRYNHYAAVEAGRAGSQVKFHVDSADETLTDIPFTRIDTAGLETAVHEPNTGEKMTDQKPTLISLRVDDATSIEVDSYTHKLITNRFDSDAQALAEAKNHLFSAQSQLNEQQTKLDAMQAKLDATQQELELATAAPVVNLDSLVNERLVLIDQCRDLLPEGYEFSGKSNQEIKHDSIVNHARSVGKELDLSAQNPAYIAARFDAMIDILASTPDSKSLNARKDSLNLNTDGAMGMSAKMRKIRDEKQKMLDAAYKKGGNC
jgi:hypothetical protein